MQYPRANLPIELGTRPGKINPMGCSLLSYTQAGLPTSSRPNPILPLQLEPDHKRPVGAECNPGLPTRTGANPVQMRAPPPLQYKQQETNLIQEEVEKLIQKGAIGPMMNPSPQQFVSQIFMVPKKDGTHRPMINLKALNKFVKRQHFKMEGPQLIKDLLQKEDWMVIVDLKDTYLSIPITSAQWNLLRFKWQDQTYEFCCLPFRLNSSASCQHRRYNFLD